MMSQTGAQTITIYILSEYSKSKGNQKMKFDQLIKYSMRNILLQKP